MKAVPVKWAPSTSSAPPKPIVPDWSRTAFEIAGGTVAEILARFERAEADGTRALSVWGSIYYHVYGDSALDYRSHTVVAVPYATRGLGFPIARGPAMLWLMEAGASSAHLMVSGR